MKHRMVKCLFTLLLMIFVISGCEGQANLAGTWESPVMEASLLGVDIEVPFALETTIRFTFEKDGTGAMELETKQLSLEESESFTYETEADQLTITYDSGSAQVYTFAVDKDTLSLDGRISMELKRQS